MLDAMAPSAASATRRQVRLSFRLVVCQQRWPAVLALGGWEVGAVAGGVHSDDASVVGEVPAANDTDSAVLFVEDGQPVALRGDLQPSRSRIEASKAGS